MQIILVAVQWLYKCKFYYKHKANDKSIENFLQDDPREWLGIFQGRPFIDFSRP